MIVGNDISVLPDDDSRAAADLFTLLRRSITEEIIQKRLGCLRLLGGSHLDIDDRIDRSLCSISKIRPVFM